MPLTKDPLRVLRVFAPPVGFRSSPVFSVISRSCREARFSAVLFEYPVASATEAIAQLAGVVRRYRADALPRCLRLLDFLRRCAPARFLARTAADLVRG